MSVPGEVIAFRNFALGPISDLRFFSVSVLAPENAPDQKYREVTDHVLGLRSAGGKKRFLTVVVKMCAAFCVSKRYR